MTRRLFFALWPDAATRAGIQRQAEETVAQTGGRPVHPENFHLTLRFLGSVPLQRLDCIRQAAAVVRAAALELSLDQLGYWPKPAVLWLGARRPGAELLRLVANLNTELAGCGFAPEIRPFKPHVTLARDVDQPGQLNGVAALTWRARDFVLVESVTTPAGARYQLLETWPLSAKPAEMEEEL